jgi:hypothetical protein
LGDEIFRLFAGLFALSLKFFQFLRLQGANDIKSRLVLKFLKVHLSAPSDCHGFLSPNSSRALTAPNGYSFLQRFPRLPTPRKMRNSLLLDDVAKDCSR